MGNDEFLPPDDFDTMPLPPGQHPTPHQASDERPIQYINDPSMQAGMTANAAEKMAMAEEAFAKYNQEQVQPVTHTQPIPSLDPIPRPTPLITERNIPSANNPLSKYFRQPGIFVHLPTKGTRYNTGDVNLNQFGQIAIKPMCAADELILKSPDALFNGEALASVITSCCPDIKNPKILLTPDVDAILLGIRVATYGDTMEFESTCPKCEQENNFESNIRDLLGMMGYLEDEYKTTTDDGLIIYIGPYNFESNLKASVAAYEEAKFIQSVTTEEVAEEDKVSYFRQSFERMNILNNELIADAILKIVTPEGEEIDDVVFISEFVENIEKKKITVIEDKIKELNQTGVNRKFAATCSECKHQWETEINFDPTHFFA